MNPANTYPAQAHRLPRGRLWYAFSAPAFAWACHGAICVFVSSVFCPSGTPTWGRPDENGVRLALGLVTLGLLGVSISAGVVSFRLWRSLRADRELTADEGYSREDFMSLGGVLVSTVCTMGIVWAGIPLIMLNVCLRAR